LTIRYQPVDFVVVFRKVLGVDGLRVAPLEHKLSYMCSASLVILTKT
jgi:hypothetical protein